MAGEEALEALAPMRLARAATAASSASSDVAAPKHLQLAPLPGRRGAACQSAAVGWAASGSN